MEGSSQIVWGMIFGAIGLGFFVYGKRQQAIVPLLTGIALFVFPYFISNAYLLVIVGIALVAVPYFFRM
jgi:predicted membrane protein